MTKQYNIPVKVLDSSKEQMIQTSLQGYRVFTDRGGNLEDTCFSREQVPYVGEVIVVKTLKPEAAQTAYEVLTGIEGLLVLPITESSWEEEKEAVEIKREQRARTRAFVSYLRSERDNF